jgi:hypothetical protein
MRLVNKEKEEVAILRCDEYQILSKIKSDMVSIQNNEVVIDLGF